MSETQATGETQVTKPTKSSTVYTDVTMTDSRVVKFPGNRKTDKTILTSEDGTALGVRFDFLNGETRTLLFTDLSDKTLAYACGHGIAQKAGDEYSGVKEVEDMVLAVDDIFTRLKAGDWVAPREAGDSTAGASIVIKAIMEATNKDVEFVKAFLQKKLDTAKAAGTKLSRQELYNSFRVPGSKTAAIIKRMEEEKLAKNTSVKADDMLAEMG